jgi:four helix bundle protein
MASYRELIVWQAAVELSVRCYEATKPFPPSEAYGMTSQVRRAATSIAANIAEGHGRETSSQFVQFLRVAQGSLRELETHLIIAQRVGLLSSTASEPLMKGADEVGKMLRGLMRTLQKR